MGLEGQKINDIKSLFTSYGIFTVQKFFNNYPHIRLVESEDTEEAQKISKNNIKALVL